MFCTLSLQLPLPFEFLSNVLQDVMQSFLNPPALDLNPIVHGYIPWVDIPPGSRDVVRADPSLVVYLKESTWEHYSHSLPWYSPELHTPAMLLAFRQAVKKVCAMCVSINPLSNVLR